MTTELFVLALGGVLLFVPIILAVHFKTKQYGAKWNMGARDEDKPPLDEIPARLERASANFQETFPLAIVALGGLAIAGKGTEVSAIAAWVWLIARVAYLPIYWAGIPKIRTLVFAISLLALLTALGVLLF